MKHPSKTPGLPRKASEGNRMSDSVFEAEAAHRSTNIGAPDNTAAAARGLMTQPWSKFTPEDIEDYVELVYEMDRVYRQFVGRLTGPSPLQVTMYSGPMLQGTGTEDVRTWIEWSGGSMSCWNAAPMHASNGGAYTWVMLSRIWRNVHVDPGLLTDPVAKKVTPHFVYLALS